VIVEGALEAAPEAARLDEALGVLLEFLPASAAAAAAAKLTGVRRNDAYARALEITKKAPDEST
jgi:hypothetical protein